ncbi:MAG TPA: SDR family NAD(P)-dependent oxidoreductase [Gemmatimonadaceae bacterium]
MKSADHSVCVVTGASSGIGRALTIALSRGGSFVWAIARDSRRLGELRDEVADAAGAVVPLAVDLERQDEVEKAAQTIRLGTDRLDLLVHSASVIRLGGFESMSVRDLECQYRVNLRAPVILTQALLSAIKRACGQVVFINSTAGVHASAENAFYAATKHGLKAIADGLRDEVNDDRVRVISVYAGRTATPMQRAVHEHERRQYDPERLLRPGDVAEVVLAALATPSSGEVTDVYVRPMAKLRAVVAPVEPCSQLTRESKPRSRIRAVEESH